MRNRDILNMYVLQITEKAKYFQQPYDHYNYSDDVEDVFDFTIHRNVVVYKPEKNTYKNNNQCNSKK
jgi:hypothetical protein